MSNKDKSTKDKVLVFTMEDAIQITLNEIRKEEEERAAKSQTRDQSDTSNAAADETRDEDEPNYEGLDADGDPIEPESKKKATNAASKMPFAGR